MFLTPTLCGLAAWRLGVKELLHRSKKVVAEPQIGTV
jgi:hypothetical protein